MGLNKSSCLLLIVLVALAIINENPANSEDAGSGGSQGNNRLSLARCNHTVVGVRSCHSCHEVILCTPLDVGIVRRCRGNKSYCNNGDCTDTPSPNCNSTQQRRPSILLRF